MRIFHFSEEPYPDAWGAERSSLRITIPNELCDPDVAHRLYHRYIDEWVLADELGYEIMLNEHHSTATCLTSSASLILSILARLTKRARLLVLGVPVGNRPDPIRVADEMAMIDVISKGRLEFGMIKGVPYDIEPANSNAVSLMPRFWEAHDLIIKAMTTTTGPFNFEGDYFHYRNINIWPRPYQQPRPPIWVSTATPANAVEIGERGHVMASFMGGIAETVKLHKAYAQGYQAAGHGSKVPVDRFAYLAMSGVARNEAEGRRRCDLIADYLRTNAKVADPFNKPPGYFSVEAAMRSARSPNPGAFRTLFTPKGRPVELSTASLDDFIECGIAFAGTPDQVFNQICAFTDGIGGLGNMLLMAQGGHLGPEDTADSMRLFAEEVMPRLRNRQAQAQFFEAA